MENLYQLLGVPPFASIEEISMAYNKMYGELFTAENPLGNIPKLKVLKTAFETLSDPEKREKYDEELREFLNDLESQYEVAVDALHEGRIDVAIEILKRCLKTSPKEPDFFETLGLAYQLRGDLDEAKKIFQQGLSLNKKKGIFNWYLGDLFRALHDDEMADTHFLDAAEEFKNTLKSDPKNVDAMEFLADTYSKMKWYEEALEIFDKLVTQFPFQSAYHRDIGAILYELDMLEEAEEQLQEALQNDPNDSTIYLFLGLTYFKQRLLGKAMEYLDESIKRKTDQPEVRKLMEKITEIRQDIGKTIEEIIQDPQPDAVVEGTVKWYNPETGVGILTCLEYPEVLLHFSALPPDERETLKKGTHLRFGVVKDPSGLIAVQIEFIDPEAAGETLPGIIEKFDLKRKIGIIKVGDGREVMFNFSALPEDLSENLTPGLEIVFEIKSHPGLGDTPIDQAENIRLRKKKIPSKKEGE